MEDLEKKKNKRLKDTVRLRWPCSFFKAQKQFKCLPVTGTSKVSKESSYCNQVTCVKLALKLSLQRIYNLTGWFTSQLRWHRMHTKSSERTVLSPTRQKSLLVPLSNFIIHLAAGEQLLNNEWPLVMECISFALKGHKNRSDTTDHREQSLLFHGSSGVETHSHTVPRPFSAT